MSGLRLGIALDGQSLDGNLTRLRTELEWLSSQGATWVELQVQGMDLIWRGALVAERIAVLQAITDDLALRYTVHAPDVLNLMAPANERTYHLEALRACIDIASILGAPVVVVHPGRFLPEEQFGKGKLPTVRRQSDLLEEEAHLLRSLGEYALDRGVQIGLENMRPYADGPYCYGERLDRLVQQVEHVNHGAVGITLDLGHAHMAANLYGFDLLHATERVLPWLRHMHVSDNFGQPSRSNEKAQGGLVTIGRGDMHAPPGFGDVPLAACFRLLSDYEGVVILEMRSRYRPHFAAAVRQLADLVEGSYAGA